MKVMAFNGGPRKTWNTATLLEKALAGAASVGAETKLVHLYDLTFHGCKSCFACKLRAGRSLGKCAARDELTPILAEAEAADALILGSPIYFGGVTGELKSFMERLMFPYLQYDTTYSTLFPRKIGTAFIHTMNVKESEIEERGYLPGLRNNETFMKRIFGACETLNSFDTCQFDDYAKVVADRFDVEKKAARRRDVFPQDCEKAYALGTRLAKAAN
jgi:multimeric flavodoxin WrbA